MESPPRTKTKTANKVQKHTDCSCSIRCGHNKRRALASKVDFLMSSKDTLFVLMKKMAELSDDTPTYIVESQVKSRCRWQFTL